MNKPISIASESTDLKYVCDRTLRRFVGYHIKRASNVVHADLAKTLKPFGLRMLTYTVLVLIVDNPGTRQSQLADAMDIERPNLVAVIDELEELNLIVRDRAQTDRRAYALRATPKGLQLYDKAVAAVLAHEEELFDGFDAETTSKVIAAMTKIWKQGTELGS